MVDGGYQRTCKKCGQTWLVPSEIAEERPDVKSIGGRFTALIGGNFADQVALRAHYEQLGAAAKCPQCGATSFTQAKLPDSPTEAPPAWSSPSNAIPAPPVPSNPIPAPPAPTAEALIYVLNQQLISLTGDSWIEDGQGNRAFEVDGSLLSLRGTHILKDLSGQTLYEVSTPLTPHVHKTITISRGGRTVATVQEAIFHLGGDKYKVSLDGGMELTLHGDWMNREFQVKDQAQRVVITASRAWFTIHDAYGIQIVPGFDVPLALAIVIALERVEAAEHGAGSPLQDLLGDISPF
jgi:uncharacterized protein YxjI/predicted nucleic-acid-binding Zn-ribbon protein